MNKRACGMLGAVCHFLSNRPWVFIHIGGRGTDGGGGGGCMSERLCFSCFLSAVLCGLRHYSFFVGHKQEVQHIIYLIHPEFIQVGLPPTGLPFIIIHKIDAAHARCKPYRNMTVYCRRQTVHGL